MAALDNEKIARGALLAAMETGKSLREKEEEEERKRRELQEQALSEYQEDNRDRFRQSGFAKEADRTAGIVGRGLVSNIIDSLVATNPNAPSKLETTGRLLYADEQGNMPEGQTGAGVLYSNLGQAIATDEANAHAEQNMGTPTEIASVELNPSNKPAFNPASSYVQEENPSAGIQKQAEDFAAEMTKNKTQSAPEGVLDNVESNVDNSKGRESFGSDFFSAMATLATFGGMIATGVGIPFALAAAAGAWTGTEPYRQRESSAAGLRKQGYSDAEITNFVYDGILNQTPNTQVQADAKENLDIKRMEKESLAQARADKAAASAAKAAGKGKEMTESQEKSLMAFRRSTHANAFFTEKFGNGETYPLASNGSFMDKVGATLNRGWARMGQDPDAGALKTMVYEAFSPEVASAMNQEIQYLSGILRKESGAAISRSEWENYGNIFFPRPHDGKDDINRKSVLRQVAAKALSSSTRGEDENFNAVLDAMVSQGIKNVKNVGSKTYVQLNDGNVLEVE